MNNQHKQLASYFNGLKIDPAQDIPANFDRIAEQLFNHWLIKVNENFYRLLESEFYDKSEHHPDVYTHGHPLQLESGRWYFHGSGVYLTFREKDIYGGILIRRIEKIQPEPTDKKEEYIFSPLNVQMELSNSLHPTYSEEANIFRLVPANSQIEAVPKDEIIQCNRIGLSAGKLNGGDYHKKHYCYLIHPHLGHKGKTNIAKSIA